MWVNDLLNESAAISLGEQQILLTLHWSIDRLLNHNLKLDESSHQPWIHQLNFTHATCVQQR